VLTRQEHTW